MSLRKGINKCIEYIFVFSVIISGGTMYGVLDTLYNSDFNDFTLRIICMGISLLLICVCLIHKKIAVSKRQSLNFIGFIIFFGIYLLVTGYGVNSCLESVCMPFILFYILSLCYGPEIFFRIFFDKYSTIVFLLSCISLVFFVSVTFFNIVPGWDIEYYNNGWWYPGKNYFYLCFTNNWQSISLVGHDIYKNIGIFMEAPGFAIILILALWWELFGRTSINKVRVYVILVTLITTFSVKSIILGMLVAFMFIYFNVPNKKGFFKKYRWALFIPIVLLFSFIAIKILGEKIASSAVEFGSWAIRISDVAAAFSTWRDFPIFGCGFYNLPEIYRHYILERHSGTPTMGLLNIFAFGGIYMFLWYFTGFYKFYKKNKKNSNKWMIRSFLVIITALFCTSGIQYNYTILLLLAIGWSIDKRPFTLNLENRYVNNIYDKSKMEEYINA